MDKNLELRLELLPADVIAKILDDESYPVFEDDDDDDLDYDLDQKDQDGETFIFSDDDEADFFDDEDEQLMIDVNELVF